MRVQQCGAGGTFSVHSARSRCLWERQSFGSEVKQVVVIIPYALSPIDDNSAPAPASTFLVILSHRAQDLFELIFSHLASQLTTSGQRDQSILDICGTRLLDQADPAQTIRSLWGQDL